MLIISSCELCGKEKELVSALVEGVKLRICDLCSRHGKVLDNQSDVITKRKSIIREELADVIVGDYSVLIRTGRESRSLTQKDLAIKLNERESLIAKIEHGSLKPTIDLAKKFERLFNIKLIVKEEVTGGIKVKGESLTIGDFFNK